MRSISKAMIAVMIAAAMCVVPLFVIEDAEAYTVTEKSTGISIKASSMEPSDFAKLMSNDDLKYMVLGTVLNQMVDNPAYEFDSFTVKEVTNLKMAKGMDVTSDTKTEVDGNSMTFKIDFTVTKIAMSTSIDKPYDGFQDLYRAFNDMPVGHKMTFKDCTVTIEGYSKTVTKFTANNDNNFVVTERDRSESSYEKVSCSDIEYKNADDVKKLEFDYERTTDYNRCTKYSFYSADYKNDVKVENVVDSTKTFAVIDQRDCANETLIKYVYDGNTYKYSETKDNNREGADTSDVTYSRTTASTANVIIKENIAPIDYQFCGDDTTTVNYLFDPLEVDASINTNEKMKEFLEKKGTVGETYSDAKSVSEAASSSVSTGSGSNNIIFYVIIGVLAVAVVALAVLLIKKK